MLTLLHLLSAVALLVWGTHIVRTGVMRVFGARLRTVLSGSVEKKPLAFCAGIGVTALVQSSNATTMLVTSFVAQDLVALAPALVIVLGADVGTALMARILTFDLSRLSPLLIFIGVIFFLGRKQSRAGQLGRVGIGLGLILLALELIVQAVTPITRANGVQVIFASLTGDIMLDALIGAVFAIVSYSSGSGPADGDLNRRRGNFLPGGAVHGDRCQPRLWPAGDAQQQRRQRCRPPGGAGEFTV